MSLLPASWQHHATGLEIGQRKDVDHDCGDGRKLRVSRNNNGYSAWCFRCSDSGWLPVQQSIAELVSALQVRREQDRHVTSAGALPEPACYGMDEWPVAARLWLYRAGLSRADAGKLGAYWHGPSARVVLPVRTDPSLGPIYYQARALDGRQPKYIAPSPRPADMLVSYGAGPFPVLTEDILSAYKIGKVCEGWPAMGTNVPIAYITEFLKRSRPVVTWLDPDGPGRKAAAKYGKQLRAYGLRVIDICSERDPKLHTLEEIRELLQQTTLELAGV